MEEEKEKVEKKLLFFLNFLSRLCLYDNFFSYFHCGTKENR